MTRNKLIYIVTLFLCTSEISLAKNCTEYRSCAEVISDHPDGNFGRRDGDNDGIPCENVCRSRKQVEDLLKRNAGSKQKEKK